MERLQKVMAKAGIASRRKCEELIAAGEVKVNGVIVTEAGRKVNPQMDQIEVGGLKIQLEKKVYYLLYKPIGYITSVGDPHKRKTVLDLMEGIQERIYPVGRLDYDTSGLLLLTNDGDLAFHMTHPSHEMEKEYEALVRGKVSKESVERLRKGVKLEDGWTAPAKVRILGEKNGNTLLQLIIHEGRNRQVRRMCDAVGHPVLKLKRTRIAFLTIGQLKPGKFRPLLTEEVKQLKEIKVPLD
jgi:23S rRNA pseudouridine2605 synthase